jgi:hypothetical protein
MKAWSIFAASSWLLAAAPPPLDAPTKEDVRCFIALGTLAQSDDPTIKTAATAGTLYFLGRLDGRSPGLDMEAAVAAETPEMTEADHAALLRSCGGKMEERGNYLIEVCKALKRRED